MHVYSLPRVVLFALVALLFTDQAATAQDLHSSRRLSPIGIARTHIGDTYVKVTYGRPYIRGREIFGANTDSTTFLVPFDEVWRTGASEATEITVTGPVMLAGNHLDAGTYSIFTEPSAESWVFHVTGELGLDGTGIFNTETQVFTPVYAPEKDLFSFSVPVHTLSEDAVVDPFTISFEESDSGVEMVLRWEWTEVRAPIQAE